jgi:hypothetical protein
VFEQKEEDEWIVEAKVEVLKLTEEWYKQYLGRRADGIQAQGGIGNNQTTQAEGQEEVI